MGQLSLFSVFLGVGSTPRRDVITFFKKDQKVTVQIKTKNKQTKNTVLPCEWFVPPQLLNCSRVLGSLYPASSSSHSPSDACHIIPSFAPMFPEYTLIWCFQRHWNQSRLVHIWKKYWSFPPKFSSISPFNTTC